MKMFYRTEDDEVYCGELHYFTTEDVGDGQPGMALMFQPKPFSHGKRFSLRNPVIKSIGVNRIHVECEGKTYLFYDDGAPWLEPKYTVASWAKQPHNRTPNEQLMRMWIKEESQITAEDIINTQSVDFDQETK